MTIIHLSETDLAYLNTLKESGRHRDNRIKEETLIDVFAEACRIKQLRYFKSAWFNPSWSSLRSNRGGGAHNDILGVLGRGQILNVLKYGRRRGLLEKVSSYRWGWTGLDNHVKVRDINE